MLLEKRKLHTIEALISKSLIDSYISHDEFVSINNALREYNEIKEEIKNPETSVENIISKSWKCITSAVKTILQTKFQMSEKLNKLDFCGKKKSSFIKNEELNNISND